MHEQSTVKLVSEEIDKSTDLGQKDLWSFVLRCLEDEYSETLDAHGRTCCMVFLICIGSQKP